MSLGFDILMVFVAIISLIIIFLILCLLLSRKSTKTKIIIFTCLFIIVWGVRFAVLILGNSAKESKFQEPIYALIFKAFYANLGGLQFEGLNEVDVAMVGLNKFLATVYYGLPILLALVFILIVSEAFFYEAFSKIVLRMSNTTFSRIAFKLFPSEKRKNVFIFTSLNEETIKLALSIYSNKKSKIIFYGEDIPAYNKYDKLCKTIKENKWYYISSIEITDNEKEYKDSKKNSIISRLHFNLKEYSIKSGNKITIIAAKLDDNLKSDDEKNLAIANNECEALASIFNKVCNINEIKLFNDVIRNTPKDNDVIKFKNKIIDQYRKIGNYTDIIKYYNNLKKVNDGYYIEIYSLVGKSINYSSYQGIINNYFSEYVSFFNNVSLLENDKSNSLLIPELYILNEANMVSIDLVNKLYKLKSIIDFDSIEDSMIVGFGELGQNILDRIYTQFGNYNDFNDDKEFPKYRIYELQYSESDENNHTYPEFINQFIIKHPYYIFDKKGNNRYEKDLKYFFQEEDIENKLAYLKYQQVPKIEFNSISNMYNLLDDNTGNENKKLPKLIVLSTGGDSQNVDYANFVLTDIKNEFKSKEVKELQIIAVNIREKINNSLVNIFEMQDKGNGIFYSEKYKLCLIIYGNTDDIYNFNLLNHKNEKEFNAVYDFLSNEISNSGYIDIDKDIFNKLYEELNTKDLEKEMSLKMNKSWNKLDLFKRQANVSGMLFVNNLKIDNKEITTDIITRNIIKEHNRWVRFHLSYGYRLGIRNKADISSKTHNCLVSVDYLKKEVIPYDIISTIISIRNQR